MRALSTVLLVVQLAGLAVLLVALLAQVRRRPRRATVAMRDGAGAALLAGLIRVPVRQAAHQDVGYAVTVATLMIGLGLVVLLAANLARDRIAGGVWIGLVTLAVLEVALALS